MLKQKPKSSSKTGRLKIYIFAFTIVLGIFLFFNSKIEVMGDPPGGLWSQINPTALKFDGAIASDTAPQFFRIVQPEIKRLVVRSNGGSVEPALEVADYISKHHLDIEISEYCYSSCANYWFTAANKKTVPQGAAVGFHGDPITSLPYNGEQDPKIIDFVHAFDLKAQVFYKKIGLNPSLFSHSVAFTYANPVDLWAPSPKELECAGVKNLEMWFPESEADYKLGDFALANTISTTAHDIRKPKPDFCQQIKSGS